MENNTQQMAQTIEEAERESMIPGTRMLEDWSTFTVEKINALVQDATNALRRNTGNKKIEWQPEIGYLIWVKQSLGKGQVAEHILALHERGIRHLRTGIAWAEWYDPAQKPWIKEYIREYAKHFAVMPCLTFTPPELGKKPRVNSAPRDPEEYGKFVADVIKELGDCFTEVELWNEWNLETDWDLSTDLDYSIFIEMISHGARRAHEGGKRTVLGGASRITSNTLPVLEKFALTLRDSIDVVGFHNLRGTWSDNVPSEELAEQSNNIRRVWGKEVPTYLTEYGFPVVDPENRFDIAWLEDIQVALFAYAIYACLVGAVDRVFWYTYKDHVSPSLRFSTTGWEDVLQHHYGDTREDGTERKLGRLLKAGGPKHVLLYAVEHGLMPLVDAASLGRVLDLGKAA